MSDEKIKEKLDKHKLPEYVETNVPEVNPEICVMMDHLA